MLPDVLAITTMAFNVQELHSHALIETLLTYHPGTHALRHPDNFA